MEWVIGFTLFQYTHTHSHTVMHFFLLHADKKEQNKSVKQLEKHQSIRDKSSCYRWVDMGEIPWQYTGTRTHIHVPFVRVPDTNLCRDWISLSTPCRQRLVQPAILTKKQASRGSVNAPQIKQDLTIFWGSSVQVSPQLQFPCTLSVAVKLLPPPHFTDVPEIPLRKYLERKSAIQNCNTLKTTWHPNTHIDTFRCLLLFSQVHLKDAPEQKHTLIRISK